MPWLGMVRAYGLPAAFVAIGIVALALGFGTSEEKAAEWFHLSGFYMVFVSFLLWLSLIRVGPLSKTRLRDLAKEHGGPVLLALGITISAFLVSPPEFRILADETNLAGVAMDMYDNHGFRNITERTSFYFGSATNEMGTQWDKRPLFFPFLVYVAHVLFGYSAESNLFLVNGLCGFGLLVAFYALLSRFVSRFLATVGMVLLAAFPLVVLWITSAGFEIPNLFFGVLAFLAFDRLLKERSGAAATYLMATLLLLSQIRYESSLFAICLLPWVPFLTRRDELRNIGFSSLLIPILFLPVVWQRRISAGAGVFQMEKGEEAFAAEWVVPNLLDAYQYFTGAEDRYAVAPLLFWMSAAGLLVTLAWFARQRRRAGLVLSAHAIASLTVVLTHAAILFFYFWGKLTTQYAMRLGLIFVPFMVVLTLIPLYFLTRNGSTYRPLLAVGAFALAAYHWRSAAGNEAVAQILIHREFRDVRGFLEREYPTKNVIVISELANLYAPFRYGSVRYHRVRQNPAVWLRYKQSALVDDVLAVQKIDAATGLPDPATTLPDNIDTETVFQSQYTATVTVRVVRLTPGEGLDMNTRTPLFRRPPGGRPPGAAPQRTPRPQRR